MGRVGILESSVPLDAVIDDLPRSQVYVMDLPGMDQLEREMLQNVREARTHVKLVEQELILS